jgi:hypothetical protein
MCLYGTKKASANLGSVAAIYTNQLTTTPASLYTYALPGQLPGLYTQQYSGFSSPQTSTQTVADFIGNVVQHNNYSANDNTEINLSLRGQGTHHHHRRCTARNFIYRSGKHRIGVGFKRCVIQHTAGYQRLARRVTGNHQAWPGRRATHLIYGRGGSQHPLNLPKPLPAYQYAYLYNEALQNDNKPTIYTASDFNAYRNHTDPIHHPDVNWFNTLLRDQLALSVATN